MWHSDFLLRPMSTKVPAKIRFKDNVYSAKIRLKGDRADHWKNNKRHSFKIEIDKGESIDTFQTFSLTGHARRQFPQGEVMSKSATRMNWINSDFKS